MKIYATACLVRMQSVTIIPLRVSIAANIQLGPHYSVFPVTAGGWVRYKRHWDARIYHEPYAWDSVSSISRIRGVVEFSERGYHPHFTSV